jgi:hypothetical protein
MGLTSEQKSINIRAGIKRKKETDPDGWEEISVNRGKTHKKRIKELKQDYPGVWEIEKGKRKSGTDTLHMDPEKHKHWLSNVTYGNGAMKSGNLVNKVSIPTTNGVLDGYIQGYENRTIDLLKSTFGEANLIKWQLRNDIYFDEADVKLVSIDFLKSLQVNAIKYENNTCIANENAYTCDHSLAIPHSDRPEFCNKLGQIFAVSDIDKYFPQSDCLVLFETKSLTGAHFMRGDSWWPEIVTKSQVGLEHVDGKPVLYFLIEQNQYGITLFVRTINSLDPIGVSIYKKKNAKKLYQKYFDQFADQIQLPPPMSFGTLNLKSPLKSTCLQVDKVEMPYLTIIRRQPNLF